jgi:hypothetical protein
MKRSDLSFFRKWFNRYVASYYGPNGDGARAIHLKEDHTARTCREITLIGRSLELPGPDLLLAETAALFHDVGRFPQWQRYGTFDDRESEDHALLGLAELSRSGVLNRIPADDAEVVAEAIRYHNVKELPTHLAPRPLLFGKLVRDADKLDIWRLVIGDGRRRRRHGEVPSYSREIIVYLREGRIPDLDLALTPADMQLLRSAWVYDLNFAATCSEVLKRRYLDSLFEQLPDTAELLELRDLLTSYLQQRVNAKSRWEQGTLRA